MARPSRFASPRFVTPRRHVARRFVRRGPHTTIIIGSGIGGYYYDPFYDPYDPYFYDVPAYDADAIADCVRRFKSYDIRTRTYLGYDGRRHACP